MSNISFPLEPLLSAYIKGSEDAFDRVSELSVDHPEICWRFLELACAGDLSDQQLSFISAGPLEDLMSHHGGRFLDRLEVAARQDPKMRYLLATVWRGGMSQPVWNRVLAIREKLGIVLD